MFGAGIANFVRVHFIISVDKMVALLPCFMLEFSKFDNETNSSNHHDMVLWLNLRWGVHIILLFSFYYLSHVHEKNPRKRKLIGEGFVLCMLVPD